MSENNNEVKEPKKSFFSKLKLWQKVIYIVIVFVIIGVVLNLITGGNNPMNIVKNGELFKYKGTTIGKAFDNFFGSPKWEYVESDNNINIVKFQGNAMLDNKNIQVKITFRVNKEKKTFDLMSLTVDGVSQPNYEIFDWLDTIFE